MQDLRSIFKPLVSRSSKPNTGILEIILVELIELEKASWKPNTAQITRFNRNGIEGVFICLKTLNLINKLTLNHTFIAFLEIFFVKHFLMYTYLMKSRALLLLYSFNILKYCIRHRSIFLFPYNFNLNNIQM